MKKPVVFILTLIYLAVSTGIVINLHYCMNKLASTQLCKTEQKKCGRCGMEKKKSKGCCRDEVKIIKIEDSQKAPAAMYAECPIGETVIQTPSPFLNLPTYNASKVGVHHSHSPPLLKDQDICVLNGVFRI